MAGVLVLFYVDRFVLGAPLLPLLAMGLLFGLFSLAVEPRLAGVGGDLGATAAVSVFAVLGAEALIAGGRPAAPP